jgi:hypothetical protein
VCRRWPSTLGADRIWRDHAVIASRENPPASSLGDLPDDHLGITSRTQDQHRGDARQEGDAEEPQARRSDSRPAVDDRPAVLIHDWQIDPAVSRPVARAPHDAGDVEHVAVVEERLAVADAHGPGLVPDDAGIEQVPAAVTEQRPAAVLEEGRHLPPDRGAEREDVSGKELDNRPAEAAPTAVDRDGQFTAALA